MNTKHEERDEFAAELAGLRRRNKRAWCIGIVVLGALAIGAVLWFDANAVTTPGARGGSPITPRRVEQKMVEAAEWYNVQGALIMHDGKAAQVAVNRFDGIPGLISNPLVLGAWPDEITPPGAVLRVECGTNADQPTRLLVIVRGGHGDDEVLYVRVPLGWGVVDVHFSKPMVWSGTTLALVLHVNTGWTGGVVMVGGVEVAAP